MPPTGVTVVGEGHVAQPEHVVSQALVLGVINGLTIGLLAVGIVLVYKANRFINLGHAQLGTLSAVLLAKFVLDWGLPWVAGVRPGGRRRHRHRPGLTERWVIRPLRARSASSETLLLVSIGIAQLLLALVFISAFRPNDDVLSIEGYPDAVRRPRRASAASSSTPTTS